MTEAQRLHKNEWQRKHRNKRGNSDTKKYEKTISGFLVRAYRNMQSRTLGIIKPHLYKGLSLLPREDFYRWSRNDPEFNYLYRVWVRSGYDRRLSPSVNRIDSTKGYDLHNIEWLTHSLNSSLGSKNRHSQTASRLCLERIAASVQAA